MGKRRPDRGRAHPGETQHAEGQHGPKTHRAFMKQIRTPMEEPGAPEARTAQPAKGRNRFAEDRRQNDEGDRNQQANRMRQAVQRGQLDPERPGVADRLNGSAGH